MGVALGRGVTLTRKGTLAMETLTVPCTVEFVAVVSDPVRGTVSLEVLSADYEPAGWETEQAIAECLAIALLDSRVAL